MFTGRLAARVTVSLYSVHVCSLYKGHPDDMAEFSSGGVEDRVKHIKKKRAQDRKKNAKKGPKARPGSASQVSPLASACRALVIGSPSPGQRSWLHC